MTRDIKAVEPGRGDGTGPPGAVVPNLPSFDTPNVAEYFHTVSQARWLVTAVTLAFGALGVLYIAAATPIYRSDVVVQVEETSKSIAGLSEVQAALGDRGPADTEMELLRSRSLVGAVVDQLGLDIVAEPKHFPLLGALARGYHGPRPAPPFLGLAFYAWGGEQLRVERLEVPEDLANAPLTLTATVGGSYRLDGPSGETLLAGTIGKPAAGEHAGGQVAMYVSDLVARPGTRFTVQKLARSRVVAALQRNIRITEQGKKTGVLILALDGADPVKAAAILDAVATTYVRQNVERKSAEAAKTLEFLESQLPQLKANVDAAQVALKGFQVRKGTLDLSREGQAVLARSVEIEKALSEAELQRAELRQRFTDQHPALLSLSQKVERLRAQRSATAERMRDLPGAELDSARLLRDVKVSDELYNVLLNKAQELRVVKSGTIGNVRVVDRASVPERPVRPVPPLVLLLSTMLGLTAGVTAAFTRKSLYTGIDDPEVVERATGLPVYATVPRSPKQASLSRANERGRQLLLASADPGDPAIEALRSLRTGLQFALVDATNNVISITGAVPEVGKSFVTVNLAHVMAAAGRRVLVLDGDMRRGRVHKFFGGLRSPGLSEVLTGSAVLSEALHPSELENLHWMATGRIPPNPAELLGSERFERILGDVSARYDLVMIDTAPVMLVTDAALIGRAAGTTLFVLRAGAHPVREIQFAVKRLAQSGVCVHGAVLNDVSGAGARYSKYRYQYKYGYGYRYGSRA